jgi:hypothetical protein
METLRVWIKTKEDIDVLEIEKLIAGSVSDHELIEIKTGLETLHSLGLITGYHIEIDRGIL